MLHFRLQSLVSSFDVCLALFEYVDGFVAPLNEQQQISYQRLTQQPALALKTQLASELLDPPLFLRDDVCQRGCRCNF
jgi:hypothetical protein